MAAGNHEAGDQAANLEQPVWLERISSKLSALSSPFPTRSSSSSDVDVVDGDGCVLPCQQQGHSIAATLARRVWVQSTIRRPDLTGSSLAERAIFPKIWARGSTARPSV